VTGGITFAGMSTMQASCSAGGGLIDLQAGGAVAFSGSSITTNGTSVGAQGGTVHVAAGGAVSITPAISASTTAASGGPAPGGGVDISGASISLGGDVTVSGWQSPLGQAIRLRATGDITTSGILDATTTSGDGGRIDIRSG